MTAKRSLHARPLYTPNSTPQHKHKRDAPSIESLLPPMLVLMVGMFMLIVGMLHDDIDGFSIFGIVGMVMVGFFTVAE